MAKHAYYYVEVSKKNCPFVNPIRSSSLVRFFNRFVWKCFIKIENRLR